MISFECSTPCLPLIQIEVSSDMLSDTEQKFLEEGIALRVQNYGVRHTRIAARFCVCYYFSNQAFPPHPSIQGSPLLVRLPKNMVVQVKETDPPSKGSQANPTFKAAILSNGEMIKVPPFIEVGEKVVIDTEEMIYHARATT